MNRVFLALCAFSLLIAVPAPAGPAVQAASLAGSPTGASTIYLPLASRHLSWPQVAFPPLVSGLTLPVQITHPGDGSGRIIVGEQAGILWVIKDGVRQATPFLDITGKVLTDPGSEEPGLLSIAFPPGYAQRGYFYVSYVDRGNNVVLSRYRITADPDIADPASEQVLLTVPPPGSSRFHYGGELEFGPRDGYLYMSVGDGGPQGDPLGNAQNPGLLRGKLLRIDTESDLSHYLIPASNPYTQTAGYRGEIWALGFRNPWRFAFDRHTGDLYIGDVGNNSYEEVDFQPYDSPGGENYGWNIMEGFHCYKPSTGCNTAGLTLPVAEYDHTQGCAVIGGAVYRGALYPGLQGIYLYGDHCAGRIWGLQRDGPTWQAQLLAAAPFEISTFGEDESGNVYVAGYITGTVYRITEAGAP
jgi:glucose/arabinose dehydrogenase